MTFLKDYTVSIMIVSLVAILLENLLPQDGNKKYCNVLIGLFVMLVILKPLTRLPHYDETFAIPALRISDEDLSIAPGSYIADSFERKLSLAISEDLYTAFGKAHSCKVFCQVNDQGQITDIHLVQIAPYSEEARHYISEKYGIKEDVIRP